jgi:hypothetical protein
VLGGKGEAVILGGNSSEYLNEAGMFSAKQKNILIRARGPKWLKFYLCSDTLTTFE